MGDIKVPFHEKRTTTISFLFVFKASLRLETFDLKKIIIVGGDFICFNQPEAFKPEDCCHVTSL